MMREVQLKEIQISEDQALHQVIILEEKEGRRSFPIYIGFFEAQAMDIAVRGMKTPRPLTHDLIVNLLNALNVRLDRVLVDELKNDTFYGKLVLKQGNGKEILVDSRPSDAVVLASKCRVPIFVADEILNEVSRDFSVEGDED